MYYLWLDLWNSLNCVEAGTCLQFLTSYTRSLSIHLHVLLDAQHFSISIGCRNFTVYQLGYIHCRSLCSVNKLKEMLYPCIDFLWVIVLYTSVIFFFFWKWKLNLFPEVFYKCGAFYYMLKHLMCWNFFRWPEKWMRYWDSKLWSKLIAARRMTVSHSWRGWYLLYMRWLQR